MSETTTLDRSNPKDSIGLTKAPLRLVPAALSIFTSLVMKLGAKKYGPYNWRGNAVRRSVYLEAALRHILDSIDGEDFDPEHGAPHEASAAACMGIILDALSTGNLIDDRPPVGSAAWLLINLANKTPEEVSEITMQLTKTAKENFARLAVRP